MLTRLRSTWLAGAAAGILALSITGFAAAALVTIVTPPTTETVPAAPVVSTVATFEDVDGDGIDDDCDDAVTVDEAAAAAALTAVDVDGDGQISTTEAAHSDRVGGKNCNHGGYVSNVSGDACDADATETDTETTETTETTTVAAVEPVCDESPAEDLETPAECPVVVVEPVEAVTVEPTVDEAPNAHGKAVSTVARTTDVGGKNCNHGGLVSETAKKDQADRELRAQERAAAKELRAQERAAAKALKSHGKGHNSH